MSIAKPQTMSLVDTISQGFVAINRRWWLVALPVLLNLAIWYGGQISFQPFVTNLVTVFERTAPAEQRDAANPVFESWRLYGQYDLVQAMDRMRVVPRLTAYSVDTASSSGLPLPNEVLPQIDPNRVWLTVSSPSTALLLVFAVNALLIPLGAVFIALVASAVHGGPFALGAWLRSLGRTTVGLLGYAALVLAAFVLVVAPAALIGLLLLAAVPPIGAFLLLLLLIVLFWLNIYIGFVPEAIALGGVDPVAALRASVALVRRSFWATLGLLLVLYVISIGLGVLWGILVGSPIGLVVAVLGSAYISSGLAAARMVFFQQRAGKS